MQAYYYLLVLYFCVYMCFSMSIGKFSIHQQATLKRLLIHAAISSSLQADARLESLIGEGNRSCLMRA